MIRYNREKRQFQEINQDFGSVFAESRKFIDKHPQAIKASLFGVVGGVSGGSHAYLKYLKNWREENKKREKKGLEPYPKPTKEELRAASIKGGIGGATTMLGSYLLLGGGDYKREKKLSVALEQRLYRDELKKINSDKIKGLNARKSFSSTSNLDSFQTYLNIAKLQIK